MSTAEIGTTVSHRFPAVADAVPEAALLGWRAGRLRRRSSTKGPGHDAIGSTYGRRFDSSAPDAGAALPALPGVAAALSGSDGLCEVRPADLLGRRSPPALL